MFSASAGTFATLSAIRNLEEMMTERGLQLDHSTIARWVLQYSPVLKERIRSLVRRPNRSWRVDETYVRVAGRWTYLYRAIDSAGNTIDFLLSPKRDLTAAKDFFRLAVLQAGERRPRVIASQWFRSVEGALSTIAGYEAMNIIRKGQIRWLPKTDVLGQAQFIAQTLGMAA